MKKVWKRDTTPTRSRPLPPLLLTLLQVCIAQLKFVLSWNWNLVCFVLDLHNCFSLNYPIRTCECFVTTTRLVVARTSIIFQTRNNAWFSEGRLQLSASLCWLQLASSISAKCVVTSATTGLQIYREMHF